MDVDIRFAETRQEKEAVYQLRYNLYVKEQGVFQEEADHENGWLYDEYDETAHIMIAELEGRIVGTMRFCWGKDAPFSEENKRIYDLQRFSGILKEEDIVIGSRFLVLPEFRGGLLSFQMFWRVFEWIARKGIELCLGNCEPHLVNTYSKIGWRPYGKMSNHPTNGLLVSIAMICGDFEHLQKMKSPILQPLSLRTKSRELAPQIVRAVEADPSIISAESSDKLDFMARINASLKDLDGIMTNILANHDQAMVLLAKSHILHCDPGHGLIHKGHTSQTLYLLLKGSLLVKEDGVLITEVTSRGSLVGEVALFTNQPRMSDVVAGKDGADVLALSATTLKGIMKDYGQTAAQILHFITTELCLKLQERSMRLKEMKDKL